jgi:hypothetical protein
MSSHLSAADLERLRAALVDKRAALLTAERATMDEQRGISTRQTEQGDVAERLIEQESALRIGTFDAALLADVNRSGPLGAQDRRRRRAAPLTPVPISHMSAWRQPSTGSSSNEPRACGVTLVTSPDATFERRFAPAT